MAGSPPPTTHSAACQLSNPTNHVQAMMATKQSYAAEEAASRVIPCVAPLAVDPVSEVRHAALAALGAFVQLLQEHSASQDAAAGAEGASQQVCCCSCWVVLVQYVLVFSLGGGPVHYIRES